MYTVQVYYPLLHSCRSYFPDILKLITAVHKILIILLKSVLLTRFASELKITFSNPTDLGGILTPSFNCSLIFFNYAMKYFSCTWSSVDTVVVSLTKPHFKEILVENKVYLRSGVLRAACDSGLNAKCVNYGSSPASYLNITIEPRLCDVFADMSFPTNINKCDQLRIDLSGSSGSCGLGWRKILFYAKTGTNKNITLIALESYLNKLALNSTLKVFKI